MSAAAANDPAPSWLLPAELMELEPAPGRPVRRSGRDWLVDSAAFLLTAGWAGLVTGLALAGELPVPGWLLTADLVAGWSAGALIWLRRRWPVQVAAVLVVTGLFSIASGMAALIALFTVAVHRRYPVALTFGALYAATALPFFAYQVNPLQVDDSYVSSVLWATAVTALVTGWGMFVRARRQLVLSLRDRAHRAEAEQQLRAEQARHLERERIAREMHDVLAHRISLVSMHAGALEFRPDAPPAQVKRAAEVIRRSSHQALQDLREVIGVLRAEPERGRPDRPQPTLADLPGLVAEAQAAGARVRCDDQLGDAAAVPAGVGRSAYRIVQEGLTNARKHAGGAAVELTVAGEPGAGLTVEVRNRAPVGGAAGAAIPGTGTGLVGLAERAELSGGRLEYGPTTEGGFRLWAWLPWPA